MNFSDSLPHVFQFKDSLEQMNHPLQSQTHPIKKWRNWLPLFVALVFITEISFLGKLDMAEKANLVNSWADSFYQFTTSSWSIYKRAVDETGSGQGFVQGSCEEWLDREDSVAYSRDFSEEPIFVQGIEQTLKSCPGDVNISLEQIPIRSLMQHFGHQNKMTLLVCYDLWSQLYTILRTTLLWHDGSIPVVVGAPNIQDFAPPTSLLHIKELKDAESVAKTMKYLAENPIAYNESLRWKFEDPSDAFKALVDMAAVHSSCRLCIFLGTMIREIEERSPNFMKRPCKCTRGTETVYHVYVSCICMGKGRFEMDSIFLRSSNLSLQAFESAVLAKFKSVKHVPVWKEERPQVLRGGDELKLYKLYPVGLTQRQALYSFRFNGDTEFKNYIESHPCAKFEAVFV